MRAMLFTVSLLSALSLGACAGGTGGQFRGKALGSPVPASQVQTVASKADVSGSYTELGIAKGSAPTAQEAVDHAKAHCGNAGGNLLVMNTPPFQSGNSWMVDATCGTDRAVTSSGGSSGPPPGTSGTGKPAR